MLKNAIFELNKTTMLNQRLAQKQLQKLSPQQIQLMKLLQVPTANIEMRVKEELEANPALEEGDVKEDLQNDNEPEVVEENNADDFDVNEYLSDDYEPAYNRGTWNYDDEEEDKTIPVAVSETFHEFLTKQLGMRDLQGQDYEIALQIIGSLDYDGYLRRDIQAIVDDLAFLNAIETTEEQIELVLEEIQTFEPAGVGARSLQECLLLQLERKDTNPNIKVAKAILKNHFDQFSKKHYSKLEAAYNLTSEDLKNVMAEVLKLNPKPGGSYSSSFAKTEHRYIVPDFIVENKEGELHLSLNSRNAPELHISNSFREMLTGYKEAKEKTKSQKDAVLFIKQKIDSAKWFIDAIKQRQETMIKTMKAILYYQNEYFLTGDETALRPMILKDIAEMTNLDISTVSRVANSKYVQTEFGTILLKFFFSESLTKDSGEEVSTREVKKILTEIISEENKKKPLSDQKLMELLKEKGYNIARRTVAKYREQLNIPVARLRKEL